MLGSYTKIMVSAESRERDYREISPPNRDLDILALAVEMIRRRLPGTWALDRRDEAERSDRGVDAELTLRAPDGRAVVLLVQATRLLNTRDVPFALDTLRAAAARWGAQHAVVPMIAARYLAPATRERIAELGGSFADATGNLSIATELPALFLRDRGADHDPWRGPGRPRGTLVGPPAARVVRALVDVAPPYTVPELAERAQASTGATYRVIDFLDREGLLERRRYGPIEDVRWRALVERWSEDYSFMRSNTVRTFIEPRGLDALTARLAASPDLDCVVTGSLAAARVAPYAPARLAMIYVRDLMRAADALELRPVDAGGNVALAVGDYEVVFERTETVEGVRLAALSQAAVDLLGGPGRNPSEAVVLLDWMEANERAWRV